jgi:hypothetical protein
MAISSSSRSIRQCRCRPLTGLACAPARCPRRHLAFQGAGTTDWPEALRVLGPWRLRSLSRRAARPVQGCVPASGLAGKVLLGHGICRRGSFDRPRAGGSLPKPRLLQGCVEALVERGGCRDGVQLSRDTPKRRPPGLRVAADPMGFGRFGASNQHRPSPQGGGPFPAVIKLCRAQHSQGYLLPALINTHCRTVAGEPIAHAPRRFAGAPWDRYPQGRDGEAGSGSEASRARSARHGRGAQSCPCSHFALVG